MSLTTDIAKTAVTMLGKNIGSMVIIIVFFNVLTVGILICVKEAYAKQELRLAFIAVAIMLAMIILGVILWGIHRFIMDARRKTVRRLWLIDNASI
jgi:L-asparagine transporter-like permease